MIKINSLRLVLTYTLAERNTAIRVFKLLIFLFRKQNHFDSVYHSQPTRWLCNPERFNVYDVQDMSFESRCPWRLSYFKTLWIINNCFVTRFVSVHLPCLFTSACDRMRCHIRGRCLCQTYDNSFVLLFCGPHNMNVTWFDPQQI